MCGGPRALALGLRADKNICSRSNLGSNLRDTEGDPARENPVNTGLYHSDILHLAGWGPGGRRFKSCLPDRKAVRIRRLLRASEVLKIPLWGRDSGASGSTAADSLECFGLDAERTRTAHARQI